MDPYLGEIKVFPWNWAPRGWALCNGAILAISQNTALFALLGTTYGGNGSTTFGLPDMRGRVATHFGPTYSQGEMDGIETVTLTDPQIAGHNHGLLATNQTGTGIKPDGSIFSSVGGGVHYSEDSTTLIAINPASVESAGGGQPHENMQPYLVLNYCIATVGVYPARN